MMKAIRIHEYGDATTLRYEDAPMPTLQPDDVLIRVAATSFNPIDAKFRAGLAGPQRFHSFGACCPNGNETFRTS